MEASPVQIIEYFDGKKQNLIPLFQRPYAWERKNWQALWDDIMIQYESDGNTRHFMGAIVSIPARAWPAGGVNKHLIIDGQQRLTTMAIILAAIRDLGDEKMADMIQDSLVNRHSDGADKLKLLPTQLDRESFRVLVIDRQLPPGDSRIKEAYDFFKKAIEGTDLNGRIIELEKLHGVIEQSLQVVMINLGEADDPYLIFESLNHKGLPLSQADLVRNYVLMRFRHSMSTGGEQERIYDRIWRPMEIALGDALEDFFRHYLIKDGEDVKKNNVYVSMKARFSSLSEPRNVEEELKILAAFSSYYRLILNPSEENDPLIRARLEAFRSIGMTTCYPLFLRLYHSYKSGRITAETFVRCLSLTESFLVRRAICSVSPSALNKLYLTWSRSYSEADTIEWLSGNQAKGVGSGRWPGDQDVERAIMEQPMYEKDITRYLLSSVEGSFGHKESVDTNVLTIEHVLPYTLNDVWKEALGPNAVEVHKRSVHNLGNLTLTGYNSELGQLSFEKKKEKLANTHIEMNRWIISRERWTEDEIQARGRELAARIVRIWPGPGE